MKSIKQYVSRKYAEREMGKEPFDCMVNKMKRSVVQNHMIREDMDLELYEKIKAVALDKKAIEIDCGFGALAASSGVVGSTALIAGCQDNIINAMGVAGVVCSGMMVANYIKDKKQLKQSKLELKKMVEMEMANAIYPDISKKTINTCIDETCSELVDEFVMELIR
jgi:hypothetical protein